MNAFKTAVAATAAAGALALAGGAQAANLFTDLGAWESAVGSWTETTSFGASQGAVITSFTTNDGVQVNLNASGEVLNVGGGWATWCCGYTGQVEWTQGLLTQTWTLVDPVTAFGVFLEPNQRNQPYDVSMTLGGDVITQTVDGNGGAKFFGWAGSGVTSFTISSSSDLGAGDVFTAGAGGVPEPATWAMMLVGFGGLGAALRSRRRQAPATA